MENSFEQRVTEARAAVPALSPEDGIPISSSLSGSPGAEVVSAHKTSGSGEQFSSACRQKLEALDGLKADGIFSDSEYQKQKENILRGEGC